MQVSVSLADPAGGIGVLIGDSRNNKGGSNIINIFIAEIYDRNTLASVRNYITHRNTIDIPVPLNLHGRFCSYICRPVPREGAHAGYVLLHHPTRG